MNNAAVELRYIYYIVCCHILSCWCIFFEYCNSIYIILILIILYAPGRCNLSFNKVCGKAANNNVVCQVADHVSVNCWLSRRSICFSLLLFRTSLSSHPTAVMRWCVVRRSALQLIQSILMSDSYRDPLTDCSPASSPAFHQFRN